LSKHFNYFGVNRAAKKILRPRGALLEYARRSAYEEVKQELAARVARGNFYTITGAEP
jgi:hypothetical protein